MHTHAPASFAHAPALPMAVEADDSAITAALLRPSSFTWHALLVAVPNEWRATGKKSAPPGSTPILSARAACALAVLQNAERIRHGKGYVKTWSIRVPACGGSRMMTVCINGLWEPFGPFDVPPAAVEITSANRQDMEETLKNLNGACDPGRRFFVVLSLEHAVEAADELVAEVSASQAEAPPADVTTTEYSTEQPDLQTWLQTSGEKPAWQAAAPAPAC